MTPVLEAATSAANQTGWLVSECDGTLAAEKAISNIYLWADLGNIEMAARTLKPVQIFAYVGFGALADIFAQLGGAVSPNTPGKQRHTQLMKVFAFTSGAAIMQSLSVLLSELEQWSASLVLENQIQSFLSHRPDRPLGAQLNHLAALAYQGDIFTLASYRKCFAKGLRLNFVPAITDEVIRVAELYAESVFAVQAQPIIQADR